MQITGPDMAAVTPGPAAAPTPRAALPPASTADPPAATQAAEAPAPDGLQLEIPAANVTVVRTAGELQRAALAGAQDIEIRAHLDLRSLELAANPAIHGVETAVNPKKFALLYASPPLRSIRGNCSEADAEAALGLPSGTFPDLLPLRPRQCLLVMEQTWLMVNSGSIWVDNLYLKLSRTRVQPSFAFITAGVLDGELAWRGVERSDVYVTATTFHGEHRGSARAIVCDLTGVAIYAWDCIFTDWAGFVSPITVKYMSMATIRDSVFRNMHLQVEIVDVSYEGMVNFQNVSFVNVSLEHGAIVSTTLNDYHSAIGFYLMYYAEDDANYDMPLSSVPPGHRTMFGEQLAVLNSTMSDCVYLLRESLGPADLLPGCPYTAEEARNRTIDRGFFAPGTSNRESTGVPYVSDYSDYMYGEYPAAPAIGPAMDYTPQPGLGPSQYGYDVYDEQIVTGHSPFSDDPVLYFDYGSVPYSAYDNASIPDSHTLSSHWTDYEVINDPWLRSYVVTSDDHVWLRQTQEALPRLAPSPAWPTFRPPLPPPQERTSLRPQPVTPSPAIAAAMAAPLSNQTQTALPAHGRRIDVMAILLIVAAEVLLAGALLWLWITKGSRLLRWPWCTRRRSMHGKGHENRKRTVTQPAPNHSSSGGQPRVYAEHADMYKGNTHVGPRGGSGSVVSNGADVPPASLLNPDYEYALPLHLALFAQPPLSHLSDGSTKAGSTVVFAPYTVNPTQPASKLTHIYTTADGAKHAGHAMPEDAEAVADGIEVRQAGPGGNLQRTEKSQVVNVTMQTSEAATGAPGRRLHGQLDSFTASDLFLGRFEMLGRHHRRRGGQAVVQFAQSRRDRCEFAIKFFLDWDAFLVEAALYAAAFPGICSTGSAEVTARAQAVSQLVSESGTTFMSRDVSKFLPQVEAVCDGVAGTLEDPEGGPLPPCIVMERGESLQDLCNRAEPDIFTVLAVLSNVSSRIAVMHALGYVHRDIKPANVMWLPRQNRWTVIDFGCIARVGEDAPLSFTLAYAPPEVAAACQARRRSIDARPALDAWSLGVTAFELLTGAPAFDLVGHGRCKVMAMLAGDLPLPWEGELSAEVQRHLGVFRQPVLQLLQRDPARRISLDAFHASCTRTRLFSSQEPAPSS